MIVIYLITTLIGLILIPIVTFVIASSCVVSRLLKIPDGAGSPYDFLPRWWAKGLVACAFSRVVVHNREHAIGGPRIFVANHLSWYDIPALGSFLKRAKFVSKAEVFKVPLLGHAMRAVGMVSLERQNKKAAFNAYETAAGSVRNGNSIVVFAEGTRGDDYPLRQFKKGPFVLAIDAGAPIVPVLVYGAREVIKRGSIMLHPGKIHVHLLEPVTVDGMTYEDRDKLAITVRNRIADALESIYGIKSPPQKTGAQASGSQPQTESN
jgi:1-acyl-sn-glycerol-3-phosphate acyltransferase